MCGYDAGVVAGLQSGVAKNAFVHPVRAMACDGTGGYGAILAALDWISINAILPAVVSMSIAATASISIDQAVNNLINTTGILAVTLHYPSLLISILLCRICRTVQF